MQKAMARLLGKKFTEMARKGSLSRRRLAGAAALLLSIGVGTGCLGSESRSESEAEAYEPFHIGMIGEDLETIYVDQPGTSPSLRPGEDFDAFRAFFGERSTAAVHRYVDERAKQYLPFSAFYTATEQPNQRLRPYQGWQTSSERSPEPTKGVESLAFNMGVQLWLDAKINGLDSIRLEVGGLSIDVDSPRAGIIGVPDHYRAQKGKLAKLSPRAFQAIRQATLVHEARHSDCTGGLLQSTLDLGRRAKDVSDFFHRDHLSPSCGHLHIMCLEGSYRGHLACDAHPWGSYPAGGLILLEAEKRPDLTALDRRVLHGIHLDVESRALYSTAAMMRGELGPPDMSHSDAVVSRAEEERPR